MSSIGSGGPFSNTKRPTFTRAGGDFLGGGAFPYDTTGYGPALDQTPGYFGDVGVSQMFPYQTLYGGIQQNYPNIQQGGNYFSGLGMQGTNQGYQNTNFLANQGVTNAGMASSVSPQILAMLGQQGQAFQGANRMANAGMGTADMAGTISPQTLWMLGQQGQAFQGGNQMAQAGLQNANQAGGITPQTLAMLGQQAPAFQGANALANQNMQNAMGASGVLGLQNSGLNVANAYAQNLSPAIRGQNTQGGSGAGQSVMQAGLGFGADLADIQQRAIAEGLPQVRASYSARGLGTSGEAARGEQDYVQRISDQMAQEAIQARLGGLGVAAQGANTAANEAAAFGNIGLGRGQLAAQATQLPQSVLNSMLQGYGLAGNVMGQAADQPGALINQYLQGQGQGLQNFGQQGALLAQAGQQPGNLINQMLQGQGLGAQNFGQLGNQYAQASQLPGNVLNQMLQGQGQGLQNFGQMGNILTQSGTQQFQPLQLAGLGAGVWGQGQQFPLDYANTVFQASRQPENWLANFVNSVPNIGSSGQKEGFLGFG